MVGEIRTEVEEEGTEVAIVAVEVVITTSYRGGETEPSLFR